MSAPRVGVLALQGDVREHVGVLAALGATPVLVREVGDLAELNGIVLPGGESTTMGRLLAVFGLLEPLRGAIEAGLPVYGSCAGLILLAAEVLDGLTAQPTLGGLDVSVRRNAFGRQVDSFETDVDVSGLATPVRAVFIRAPWVERVGPGVEVLARVAAPAGGQGGDAGDAGRVVAVRQAAVLATAFHPELTGDRRVHGLFLEMVKEARR